ncbi:hypothetical protein BDQ12DRAFT_693954 [Crucibulum laeve]|uniref:Uncharacterized protein n=1 Tax=Crucibulum laeve TaxID=68775 RepID=A0A5C3LEM2_9AGAR|nr:hypothetical protein BDQ12DRAFT_693954 [Crucibulum laeve]
MQIYPQLTNDKPPPTLLAQWEESLNIQDPSKRSKEGRNCCPDDFVLFLSEMKENTFVIDSGPGTKFKNDRYRIDVQRKGSIFSTLAIQTNGQNSKTVCNLYIPLEDVQAGWITTLGVKEAFRHMFKTRKWQKGGHMTILRDERPASKTRAAVIFVYGRPMGGA